MLNLLNECIIRKFPMFDIFFIDNFLCINHNDKRLLTLKESSIGVSYHGEDISAKEIFKILEEEKKKLE
jgi:hypothetical protein